VTLPLPTGQEAAPPNNHSALAALYNPVLEQYGYTLSRASAVDSTTGRYGTNGGDHLALYAQPTRQLSPDDYARGLWDLAALFATDVFDRWPGLRSFDICQEQPDSENNPDDEAVTQLAIERSAATGIDWTNGQLDDLLAAAASEDITLTINSPASESSLLQG
jgi:hypothetical protein